MQDNAVVLLSGGIDSAVCMNLLLSRDYNLLPIFVDFGQPAAPFEWSSAQRVSAHFGCEVRRLEIRGNMTFGAGEIIGRNAFLSFAALTHAGASSGTIVLGIHAGTPYYDCSPAFSERMEHFISECSGGRFSFFAPLLRWSKSDVYQYLKSTDIDYRSTYSCEAGIPDGCGICLSCLDRMKL